MLDVLSKGWVGSLIGLIGIAIGYFLYRRSLRIPAPRVSIRADHALTWSDREDLPKGFEIKFNQANVPRVSRSIVRVWNGGTACWPKALVAAHDPLRLALENGGQFLAASILKESNPSSKSTISIDSENPAQAIISFEFLDPDDGFVIGVLHTDPKAAPLIKGSVMGYKFKIVEELPTRTNFKGHRKWIKPLVFLWMPLTVGIAGVFLALMTEDQFAQFRILLDEAPCTCPRPERSLLSRLGIGLIGVSYIAAAIYHFWKNRRSYPKSLSLPPG